MTTFQIKLLAAILMLGDHIGTVFFPDVYIFKYLGRLSFPLFAWLLGQGEKYTKNFKSYLLRLIVLAIVSQPIYLLAFQDISGGSADNPNILVTLALGLLAIRLDKVTHLKFVFTCIFAVLAELIRTEYGSYGVLLIALLANFDSTNVSWWMVWSLLNLVLPVLRGNSVFQSLAVFSPMILFFWNGERGRKARWFYLFYPVHLALIFLIKMLLNVWGDVPIDF